MKAVLSRHIGGPETLIVDEVPEPRPAPGEVVVAVRAIGINFPDVLIIEDKYQFKPERPFSPGAEISGIVEELGEGVKGLRPGDRVLAMLGWGGMAEKVAVPAVDIFTIPGDIPFDEAAAFIMTYGTSYHALKERADLQPGETLLVLGAAGGVGLAAVQLGSAMGARVVAAASSRDKLDIALAAGAEIGLVYCARSAGQTSAERAVRRYQIRLRRRWAERHLRSGRRRLFRAGAAFDRMGGTVPGGGIPGGHRNVAAQPAAAEGLRCTGRLLGCGDQAGPGTTSRCHRRTNGTLFRWQDQATHPCMLSARKRWRGNRSARFADHDGKVVVIVD